MKVGVMTNSLSWRGGGIFSSVQGLCTGLRRKGCEIRVFAPEDGATPEDLCAWGETSVAALPIWGPTAFGFLPRLSGELDSFKPSVLHVNRIWNYEAVAAIHWKRKTGKPYIISPYGMLDSWALEHSAWKKRLAAMFYQSRFLTRADCIHALNISELQAIRALNLENPVAVIPSGVELPGDANEERAPDWASALPKETKVLLFLGRLHPKKGLAPLLHAWARAGKVRRTTSAPWNLVIAGWDQSGHQERLKNLARDLGIADSVLFVGAQFERDKAASLQRADAFVLPSFSEGLPIAVLEAWASRLPVVMTPQCNLPEGFETGAALAVEPETDSIAEGLKTLFAMDSSVLLAMGIRGRQLVESQFTWSKVASEMYEVYQWLLGRAEKPACVVEERTG